MNELNEIRDVMGNIISVTTELEKVQDQRDEALVEMINDTNNLTLIIIEFWSNLPDSMSKDFKERLTDLWFSSTFLNNEYPKVLEVE